MNDLVRERLRTNLTANDWLKMLIRRNTTLHFIRVVPIGHIYEM